MKYLVPCLSLLALSACPTPTVTPLVGEDPEVVKMLGAPPDDDPAASPLGAARRLHQALVQQDTDRVWGLLASTTKRALDERGAAIATSGRELLDDSTLPAPNGAVRKVRYETLFFGVDLVDLEDTSGKTGPGTPGETRPISAVSKDGTRTQLDFVRESDGWKLHRTSF